MRHLTGGTPFWCVWLIGASLSAVTNTPCQGDGRTGQVGVSCMITVTTPLHSASTDAREHLRHVLDHAAHYLPTQGPIGVFVHHNTLHAFQHQDFEQSVIEAANLFQAEPFLSEEEYQACRRRGRILDEDVQAVLEQEPDADVIPGKLTRRQLRHALLIPGVRRVNGLDIAWQVEEGD